MPEISLLLVDDELSLLGLLKKYLQREGFLVETAENGAGALAATTARQYDLIVLDLQLPDIPGEQVMQTILRGLPACLILVSSGTPFSNEGLAEQDRKRVYFLMKPYMPRQLLEAIQTILSQSSRAQV